MAESLCKCGARVDDADIPTHPCCGVGGWLPIASAPKDGTQILGALVVRGYGEKWWQRHVIAYDDERGGIDPNSAYYHGWAWNDYTHWMPLPEPPK